MGRYDRELAAGIDAVRAAARICRAVALRLVTADRLEKKDQSPVTVADFASQAIVCQRLERAFPGDRVVGEERLLQDLQPARDRFRDVRQGPDGAIYLLTDNAKGRILKLVPKS